MSTVDNTVASLATSQLNGVAAVPTNFARMLDNIKQAPHKPDLGRWSSGARLVQHLSNTPAHASQAALEAALKQRTPEWAVNIKFTTSPIRSFILVWASHCNASLRRRSAAGSGSDAAPHHIPSIRFENTCHSSQSSVSACRQEP